MTQTLVASTVPAAGVRQSKDVETLSAPLQPWEEGRVVTGALQVASDSQARARDLGQGNCKSLPRDSSPPYGSVMTGTDTPGLSPVPASATWRHQSWGRFCPYGEGESPR